MPHFRKYLNKKMMVAEKDRKCVIAASPFFCGARLPASSRRAMALWT
jgi:hypothetical protein